LIVRCASCQTEFALDDRQVGPDGASVRCSLCGHVFRASAPDGVVAQPWQVRTIDDLLFTAPDLATLHSWVTEGRLHPDDQVSRSGRHFVKLGEMPEFAEAFAGFVGLPGVLETEGERGASEQSALDVLGPPPAFGTHAGEDDSAALAGVPEPQGMDHSAMLERPIDLGAPLGASASSSSFALDDAAVARGHDFGGVMPAAQPASPPPPPPPRPSARHPTPVPGSMAMPRTRPPSAPPARATSEGRGVPSHLPEDRGSRPMSMLDVVTHHVRPIAAPAIESSREADSAPVSAAREAAREVMPPVVSAPVVLAEAAPRRGGWKTWAALGLLAGGAVVFGLPQIRGALFGTTPPPAVAETVTTTPPATDDRKLLEDAAAAIDGGDPQALARAEAALVAAAPTRDAAESAALRVTAAEVLATRAVVHELWGAVEPAMRSDARFWAQEDAARAAALLAEMDGKDPSVASAFARATALLRVVQGRGDATGLAVDEEIALLVSVAPLLRDPTAKLPDAVRQRLGELATPSVLARVVLALGHVRAGDTVAARKVIEGVLAQSPGQPVARVLGRAVAATNAGPAPTAGGGEEPIVVADTSDGETTPTGPVVTTESVGSLIDRGCRKAESGDGAGAVALLKKALEKRPNDTDALLCMGDASSKLGEYGVALKHYERALGRAPQMMSALQGAGRAAAKLGRTAKAVKFYERLLEHDPSHAQARAFVDAHKNDAPGEETDNG